MQLNQHFWLQLRLSGCQAFMHQQHQQQALTLVTASPASCVLLLCRHRSACSSPPAAPPPGLVRSSRSGLYVLVSADIMALPIMPIMVGEVRWGSGEG